jgi:hypothetical protein
MVIFGELKPKKIEAPAAKRSPPVTKGERALSPALRPKP